jgi:hypothetical protein
MTAVAQGPSKVTYKLENIMMNGCDQMEFGVVINGQQQQLGTNAGNTCLNTLFFVKNQRVSVPVGAQFLIYLHDNYCNTTYYTDGTGIDTFATPTGDHAGIYTGGGSTTSRFPVQVDIADAGGSCSYPGGQAYATDIPAQGFGNLDLITNASATTLG